MNNHANWFWNAIRGGGGSLFHKRSHRCCRAVVIYVMFLQWKKTSAQIVCSSPAPLMLQSFSNSSTASAEDKVTTSQRRKTPLENLLSSFTWKARLLRKRTYVVSLFLYCFYQERTCSWEVCRCDGRLGAEQVGDDSDESAPAPQGFGPALANYQRKHVMTKLQIVAINDYMFFFQRGM